MTTQDNPIPHEAIKERQQKTWSSGGKIAWLTVPLADELCDSVDLRPGSTVLDVATGTGARCPGGAPLLRRNRRRLRPRPARNRRRCADAEGLAVEFREGDAESLPFGDRAHDYVLSAIGVMFTADHERAARELTRVCRPGGVVVNWTPTPIQPKRCGCERCRRW